MIKRSTKWLSGASLLLGWAVSIAGDPATAADPKTTDRGLLLGAASSEPTAVPSIRQQLARVDRRTSTAPAADFTPLRAMAIKNGKVRVIVGLQMLFQPEGLLGAPDARRQRAAIRTASDRVVSALSGTQYRVIGRFALTPAIALELSPAALNRLQQSGVVASIQLDALAKPVLADSAVIVESNEAAILGRTGAGQTVAILDTGVDSGHPFLVQASGDAKVVGEACYSAAADCPGGVTESTAPGSGVPCTYSSLCNHGTHVAGIAAGRGGPGTGTTINGVARNATLYSINVFSDITGCSPCSYTSDQIKGLERVFLERSNWSFASVNMSLGGGKSTTACDTDTRKLAIDNLLSVGIATIIASGNNGFSDGVSFPGCISTAITVGSTNKSDAVSGFSNSASLVDLLAPGESIQSSVPGGGFAFFSGTSMATPQVAGAWALVQAATPGPSTVATIESALETTGKLITDPDNSIARPRIRALAASAKLRDTGFRTAFRSTGRGLHLTSNGAGLATRAGGPTSGVISIVGIPPGATVRKVYLYWVTQGGPDASVVFKGLPVTGTLIGAGADTCWGRSATRVYRALIPNSSVPANGNYSISGVGGIPDVDGTGASLVVLFTISSSWIGHVTIRDGALTTDTSGEIISHAFTGLSVPRTPLFVRLHVGLGDGQPFPESAMRFRGTNVSAANAFSGTDGAMWDDQRLTVPLLALSAGTFTASNAITTITDCLSWAYSALAYTYPASTAPRNLVASNR